MLALIKTAGRRWDWEGSPPGQDWSWDNLPGNEKVELSAGNIKIIIIICHTVIYIFTTAPIGYLLRVGLIVSELSSSRSLSASFQTLLFIKWVFVSNKWLLLTIIMQIDYYIAPINTLSLINNIAGIDLVSSNGRAWSGSTHPTVYCNTLMVCLQQETLFIHI